MNARVIKDYDPINHNITPDFLYKSNDWDLVELNYNLEIEKLQEWYFTVSEKFSNMRFDFNKNPNKIDLELSRQMVKDGYCGYYCGPIDGITMAWPVEKYEPLPPPMQCNLDYYPEVNRDTFFHDAKIMPKFIFGYFEEMLNILGQDSFKQALITTHYPKMYIRQHTDSKVLKLHIPVDTTENALFHFGENRERSYHMKLGKIYILNTGEWHGTSNECDSVRSHIITRVADWKIMDIIGLTND